jgi:hypothetical protein
MQSAFEGGVSAFQIDLEMLADPNFAHLVQAQLPHCLANRRALRIKYGCLGFDHDVHLHALNIEQQPPATSDNVCRPGFWGPPALRDFSG